jgi:hypothetical protein
MGSRKRPWSSIGALQAPSKKKPKGKWPKGLTLLQRALTNALASSGVEQRPSPNASLVRAVDAENVRAEFYRTYVTDGSPEQQQETRRKAFNRAIRNAQERSLIGVCASAGRSLMWPTETPA